MKIVFGVLGVAMGAGTILELTGVTALICQNWPGVFSSSPGAGQPVACEQRSSPERFPFGRLEAGQGAAMLRHTC
jgi:hypothetical protein